MPETLDYRSPPTDPRGGRRTSPTLIAFRTICGVLTVGFSWLYYEIWYNGPSGSGGAMERAVDTLEISLGCALFFHSPNANHSGAIANTCERCKFTAAPAFCAGFV
jgi:hypothetical protein